MFSKPRVFLGHGSNKVVVRGTVCETAAAEPATGWLRWLKKDILPSITVTIDDAPYDRLTYILFAGTGNRGTVKQTLRIGWDSNDPMPKKQDRVWVTFHYARAEEICFQGALPVSFGGIKVISNEWQTQEDEVGAPRQPRMVLKVVGS